MIIYPAIDIRDGKCVRLHQGRFEETTVYGEDPAEVAERWRDQGAEWLHLVDLDGARNGGSTPECLAAVDRILSRVSLPVQLGGGIRTAEQIQQILDRGLSRVIVGTAVARDACLAGEIFQTYGDKVAVGVDARDGMVAVQGWLEHIGETALLFVARMADLGAKRFIFTDISRDGTLAGVNLTSLAQVAAVVPNLPVIASGGVASVEDVHALQEIRKGVPNIEGVIIGKALYAGTITLREALEAAAEIG